MINKHSTPEEAVRFVLQQIAAMECGTKNTRFDVKRLIYSLSCQEEYSPLVGGIANDICRRFTPCRACKYPVYRFDNEPLDVPAICGPCACDRIEGKWSKTKMQRALA